MFCDRHMWFKSCVCCWQAVWLWTSCLTSLSFSLSVFLCFVKWGQGGGNHINSWGCLTIRNDFVSVLVYIRCSVNGICYHGCCYCWEPGRLLILQSFREGKVSRNHQDQDGTAELDLNILCVSVMEIFFFPLWRIQVSLRRDLSMSSLHSGCFRDD